MRRLTDTFRRARIVKECHLYIVQCDTRCEEVLSFVSLVMMLMSNVFGLEESKAPITSIHIPERILAIQVNLQGSTLLEGARCDRAPIGTAQVFKNGIVCGSNMPYCNKACTELQITSMTPPLREKGVRGLLTSR